MRTQTYLVITAIIAMTAVGCGLFDDAEGGDDDIACMTVEEPVCGEDGETYSNACYAGKDDVEVVYHGACEGDDYPGECDTDWEPVCVEDGGQMTTGEEDLTFVNECFAEKHTGGYDYEGECEDQE